MIPATQVIISPCVRSITNTVYQSHNWYIMMGKQQGPETNEIQD